MKKLLILGAGGHGKVILDLSLRADRWDEISFLDDRDIGTHILGYSLIGKIKDYIDYREYTHAIVAIGNNDTRLRLTKELVEIGYEVPTLIHPSAIVSPFSRIGVGSVVLPQAVIHTSAQIGSAVIINSGAIIEHDCQIDDGVHLSPRATLGGGVKIGEKSWIGMGANIIQEMSIGREVTIGAGSVVINHVGDGALVVGVPGKMKERSKR